jgi:predicted nucleic acid-binding protein
MELLIDTNIIYYLTGASCIKGIDVKKLEHELSNYELVISKWTLIEIISSDEMSEQQRENALKYIAAKIAKVYPIIGITAFDFMPLNLFEIIHSPHKDRIINSIIKEKKKCEAEFIACYIKSVICIFSSALYYKMEAENNNDKGYFMNLTMSFILSNNDFIDLQSAEYVDNFYISKNESLFKSEVDGFIYTLLYAHSVTCIEVKQGYTSDIFSNIENILTETEKEWLTDGIISPNIINSLLKKMCGMEIRNISKKIGDDNIRKGLSAYKTVIGTRMADGVLNYIITMIEKTFSDDMKITKNDVIDSQLLYYYPKLQLFTFDNRLKEIIKKIDEQYYSFIINLKNKCKE